MPTPCRALLSIPVQSTASKGSSLRTHLYEITEHKHSNKLSMMCYRLATVTQTAETRHINSVHRYISEMRDSDVTVDNKLSSIPVEHKQLFHSTQHPVCYSHTNQHHSLHWLNTSSLKINICFKTNEYGEPIYSAPQCSHCKRCTSYSNSVCLSVCLSVTCRNCVKMTACSTVQFALSDSKMCLSFLETKKIFRRDDPFPWNLGLKWDTKSEHNSSELYEFWHALSCSASMVRDRKRSSITVNKKSTRAFQWAINQGSMTPLTSSKWGSNT